MLDYILANLDSIDLNHPRFRSRACTRCLGCKGVDLTVEQRGEANFWRCNECQRRSARGLRHRDGIERKAAPEFAAVGLCSQHQLTRKIRWRKRYPNAGEVGTPLDFVLVPPESPAYAVVDYGGFRDEDWLCLHSLKPGMCLEEDVRFDGSYTEFTSLAPALVYIAKELKRGFYSFDMTVDGNPLTYHEIMEAFAPPR